MKQWAITFKEPVHAGTIMGQTCTSLIVSEEPFYNEHGLYIKDGSFIPYHNLLSVLALNDNNNKEAWHSANKP